MSEIGGILVFENTKKLCGMFVDVNVPINETNVYWDENYKYNIPTMEGLVIMFSNDTGSHSPRIKVALIDKGFTKKSNYYEVYCAKGDRIEFKFDGRRDETGLKKRRKEIEEFYLRNKKLIDDIKFNKGKYDNYAIYRSVKETEDNFVKMNVNK